MDERADLIQSLNHTRARLLETVAGLSESQWRFCPGPSQWSVLENVEHVVLTEQNIQAVILRLPEAEMVEAVSNPQLESIIRDQVPVRTMKLKGPPQTQPSERWTPEEALSEFETTRRRTLEMAAECSLLRGRAVPHPALGKLDGYQWLLAASAHCARHTNQIVETIL